MSTFTSWPVSPGDPVKLPAAVGEAGWSQLGWLLIFVGACVVVTCLSVVAY